MCRNVRLYTSITEQTFLNASYFFVMSMGGAGSKPEDVAKIATIKVDYSPPLGPPNPVRNSMDAFMGHIYPYLQGSSEMFGS